MAGEILSIKQIMEIVATVGVPGLVIVLWWLGDRRYSEQIMRYQVQIQAILTQYADHIKKLEHMYETNVELVKAWQRVAESQESTIAGTVTAMTRVEAKIEGNRFCPVVREKWSVKEG